MERTIVISNIGGIVTIHNDAIDLSALGILEIYRVSDIKWDVNTQSWSIWWKLDSAIRFVSLYTGFISYSDARDFEIKMLEYMLKTIDVESEEWYFFVDSLRKEYGRSPKDTELQKSL